MRDWAPNIDRIQRYIGVEPMDLAPSSSKQETRLLRDAIANYDEISEYVRELGHPEWLDPEE